MRISDWSSDVCSSDLVLVNVRSCRPERGLPVRERAGRTQGDRAHLRISAYIGVCHCGQTAVSKLLYAIWTREIPMFMAKVAGKNRFKVWDAPLRLFHRFLSSRPSRAPSCSRRGTMRLRSGIGAIFGTVVWRL